MGAPFCRATRWSTCALTGQPLESPIAVDWLGSLFNRAAVLEFLLGRAGVFTDESAQVRDGHVLGLSTFVCVPLNSAKSMWRNRANVFPLSEFSRLRIRGRRCWRRTGT